MLQATVYGHSFLLTLGYEELLKRLLKYSELVFLPINPPVPKTKYFHGGVFPSFIIEEWH